MLIDSIFSKSHESIGTSKELYDYLAGTSIVAGVRVTPEIAMRHAAVYSCVRVLSQSVGQLPLNVKRITDDSANNAVDHRSYKLLHDAPNGYMTSLEWREMLVAHLCMRGNHYVFKNKVRGEVRELLPLNPDAVRPKITDDYDIVYDVTFANGTSDILTKDEIIHFRDLTLDGVIGLSVIQQMANSISLGVATEKHSQMMFNNGARLGGVLSTENNITGDQIKLIRSEWDKVHGGVENAHKTAILTGGLKWTQIGLSNEDAQFVDQKKLQRSEIAGGFRVPPHKIGDLENATFSNIEHQALEFVTDALMPYLVRIEQTLNMGLFGPTERNRLKVKFNVNGLLRGDMKSRGEFYTKMVMMGAYSPNDIRKFEDENPREGGDIYLTPVNMTTNPESVNYDEGTADAS